MGTTIRTLTIGLLSVFALLAACMALPPATPPAARITVHAGAQGLRAAYALAEPATSFAFTGDAGDIRTDTWRTTTPGAKLGENTITFEAPTRAFEIEITPDTQNRDRIYPALRHVGAGWAIYAPHLLPPEAANLSLDLVFDMPKDWTVAGHRDANEKLVLDGWIFAGPAAQVERGDAMVAADSATPPWLREQIIGSANKAAAFYTDRLGVSLVSKPTIIISYDAGGPNDPNSGFRGDVTPGAMMSVTFFGSPWRKADSAASEQVREFIAHEMFHFWNGDMVDSAENSTRPWLHEGGADYAAMLLLAPSPDSLSDANLETLNGDFKRCQSNLRDSDSLMSADLNLGQTVYACGAVLQWAWDAGLRTTSDGKRDILSLWRDLIAKARAGDGKYSLEDAVRFVPAEAAHAASILLNTSGKDRWSAFSAAMARYGARLSAGRDGRMDREAALMHILNQHCNGRRGYTTFDDHIKLDTQKNCGPLNGDADFDTIAGLNFLQDGSAIYDRLTTLCAAGGGVEFGWRGKTVVTAPCTKPLPPARDLWKVEKAFHP